MEAAGISMQAASAPSSCDSHLSSEKENTVLETEAAGPPHDALFLVLAYLPLFELLATSEVCVSLRDAVVRDVLPWLNIIVEKPLNLRLSDEILMEITSKANGRLKTLALMNCVKITDDGLQHVIERNLSINKLYIPACTGLTPEGIIRAVKTLSENDNSLKRLRIYGICNMNKEHLEALHSLLPAQEQQQSQQIVLFANYARNDFLTFRHQDHNRAIDVETCRKCNEVRLVFDCPREACKWNLCKGCKFCIPRCVECSGCIKLEEMEEAVSVCGDDLCLDCWFQLPKCNFCNKPYCTQHADQPRSSPDSAGFICCVCDEKTVQNLTYVMEQWSI